jgi:uncharacterized membrane protein YfcA
MLILGGVGGGSIGALGLAGNLVYAPVFLALRVPPQVVTATGMYMSMWASLSNTVNFYLFGSLLWDYALWIGFLSSMGIIISLYVVNALIARYKRPSIIVLVLGCSLVSAGAVFPYFSIKQLGETAARGVEIWAFRSIC